MSNNSPTLFGSVSTDSQSIRPIMNVAERTADPDEVILRNNDNLMAKMRVAIPAQVVSFDPKKQTIVAQPLIKERIIDRTNGAVDFVQLPQLLDVPVQFPQAGNFVLTMPIQKGDEVMVVFQDMCIDSWWASGGIQNWNDRRRHDLSDAIAIPGINSVPNVIDNISATATELRTKDNKTKVSVAKDQVNIVADTNTTINVTNGLIETNSADIQFNGASMEINITGNVTWNIEGNMTITSSGGTLNFVGDIQFNGHEYLNHEHTGVQTGGGNTGGVIQV